MNKNTIIGILVIIITFIIGFFVGQEYTKYKIATMVGQAFGGLGNNNKVDEDAKIIDEKIEKKEITSIKKGDSYNFSNGEGEEIKIKINEIKDYGKKYETSFGSIEGNNNIVGVRLESENTGKKQTFKSLSEYNIKLITADGMEFGAKSVEQAHDKIEGFGGCISCSSNPGEKNVEDILFDIDPKKIEGAKIILDEDDNVTFEL